MSKLVLIGVGNVAIAVSRHVAVSNYDTVYGTTRQKDKADSLAQMDIHPIVLERSLSRESLESIRQTCENSHVVVSFPPSTTEDQALSSAVSAAEKIVYISSTGVYGGTSGIITEASDVEIDNPSSKPRLQAEEIWRSAGAIVLRVPALYGPQYGLHINLKAGKFKIPGAGDRYTSRIHLDDLASIVIAALRCASPRSLYVVGDDKPTTHIEVVSWLCRRMSIELPGSIPLDQAPMTLRGNRQILAEKIKSDLGIVLKYPTYVEGFEQCLSSGD